MRDVAEPGACAERRPEAGATKQFTRRRERHGWREAAVPGEAMSRESKREVEIAKAWLPPLRPNTRYTVRLRLPNLGNCVYATLGSFSSGPPQ